MTILLTVFNIIARYMHFFEKMLVNVMHVSDCVTTLDTEHIVSTKILKHVDFLYGHNSISYKLRIPVSLSKEKVPEILSATVNDKDDITEYVKSVAGPFNNFFMQRLTVGDIIPEPMHNGFVQLEVMDSDVRIHTYSSLDEPVKFHYGASWPLHDHEGRISTLLRMDYLDLAI